MSRSTDNDKPVPALWTLLLRLVLACLLPCAVAVAAMFVHQYQIERTHLETVTQRVATNLRHAIDSELGKLKFMAVSLAATPELKSGDLAGFHRRASELLQGDTRRSHVVLLDDSGQMRINTLLPMGEPLPRSPLAQDVQGLFRTGQPFVSRLFTGSVSGQFTLAVYVPVRVDDKVAYALGIGLGSQSIDQLLREQQLPQDWVATVVDSQGIVAARTDPAQQSVARPVTAALAAQIARAPEGTMESTTPDGTPVFTYYSRSPLAGWSVVVEAPRASIVATLSRRALVIALGMALLAAFCLVFATHTARRIATDVTSIQQQGFAIARGQEVPEPAVQVREVADVAHALAQASVVLNQRGENLMRTLASLELSDARLRGIFDSATDAIIIADESQHIVMANRAASEMFRRPVDALIGLPVEQLMPERHWEQHGLAMRDFGTVGGPARAMGRAQDVVALRPDGEEFPVEAAISQLQVAGQRLYTAILRDVTDRRRAEVALLRSEAAVRQMVTAHDLVQENERKRIARELHDELQQSVGMIRVHLASADAQGAETPARIRALLRDIDNLAASALASIRRIVSDLRPPVLEDLGLAAALGEMCTRFTERTGIDTDLDIQPEILERPEVAPSIAFCLYRVLQEALNNVAKHARADTVEVRLVRASDGHMTLRVTDDGCGMVDDDRRKPDSFGLVGMQERLRTVGGTLRVVSAPGDGTTIEATVPLEPPIG